MNKLDCINPFGPGPIGISLDSTVQRRKTIYIHSLVDRHDRTWFGSSIGGLVRYDRKADEVRRFDPDPSDLNMVVSGSVSMLFECSNGWIYILTADGISVYLEENNHFVRLELSEGLSQRSTVAVIEDVSNLELEHTQSNFIGFCFVSPDFRKGDRLEYFAG